LRFTVRRPPTGEVSPCGHRPSGGDIACGVHVGIARPGIAGFALEHRLALAVFGCDVPTRRASLRGPLGFTRRDTRCMQKLTGGQCRRHRHTGVNTDHAAVAGTGDRVRDVRERDMPAAGTIAGDPVGLHTSRYWPRQPESHPPDLGHPYPADTAVEPLDVMRFHRNLPDSFVHTAFTPCWAAMGTGEEVAHCLGEISQRLLLHCLTASAKPRVFRAGLSQLSGLLDVAGSPASGLPVQLLLHREIPHKPRIPAARQQRLLLLRDGQQPEPSHSRTVTRNTDIPRRARPRAAGTAFLPGLEVRGFQPKERR
jgi:hypothetical protein